VCLVGWLVLLIVWLVPLAVVFLPLLKNGKENNAGPRQNMKIFGIIQHQQPFTFCFFSIATALFVVHFQICRITEILECT
jgi:hypothetical protein